MKILKILGIAVGIHAIALLLIFANPGCSNSSAADSDSPPISSAPDGSAPAPLPTPAPDTSAPPSIRYSPTRPNTTVAAALEEPPVSGVTPASTYTVVRGDSLWSVASKNHMTKAQLAAANKLRSNAVLKIGQKLIIPTRGDAAGPAPAAPAPSATSVAAAPQAAADKPAAETVKHVVRPGETLSAIAHKYGVRQGDLAVANNITDPKKIHPGQELVIPARSTRSVKGSKGKSGTDAGGEAAASGTVSGSDDLDAGLKPAQAADVPAVKVDDPGQPTPQPQKSP